MNINPDILIVEDDLSLRESMSNTLRRKKYNVKEAGTVKLARKILKKNTFDLILLDLSLPDGTGMDILKKLDFRYRNRVIIVSGTGTIKLAVEAMRRGAFDFLEKPIDRDILLLSVEKVINVNRDLDNFQKLKESPTFERIVYRSRAMADVIKQAKECARTDKTVLITGETGTGKELFAHAIHNASDRLEKPFVTVNCAAIPISLAESEFFGFEKGAFTGAESDYPGKFMLADTGTIFLDEVGELNLEIQPKLLRVLESREISSLKSRQSKELDIRVIAATNKLLDGIDKDSDFRQDLYYRLEEITLRIPPLRERKSDIIPLARHFVTLANITSTHQVESIAEDAEELLTGYHWPGNVRELKNTIDKTMAFIRDNEIKAKYLPSNLRKGKKEAPLENSFLTLEAIEKKQVEQALRLTGYNIQRSARLLGIGRPAIYRKIEKYGLQRLGKQ
jgi:DNA-binding NtrC family response regulator